MPKQADRCCQTFQQPVAHDYCFPLSHQWCFLRDALANNMCLQCTHCIQAFQQHVADKCCKTFQQPVVDNCCFPAAAAMCHSLSPSVPECHNVFSDRPRSLTSALMSHMHTNTADSAGSSPDIHFPVLHSENVAPAVAEPDMGMPTWIEHAKWADIKLLY